MKRRWLLLRLALRVAVRRLTGARCQPPCPFRMEMLLEMLRQRTGSAGSLTMAEMRRLEVAAPVPNRLVRRLRVENMTLGGVHVESLAPRDGIEGRVVLYFHGGGYNLCSPNTHRGLTSRLAIATGARVVVASYRLAPEHPHPAALEDALAVYRALLEGGTDTRRLVVAGDSAGGGLSLALMLSLRQAGEPLPATAVLLSPWVDLTLSGDSIDTNDASDYCSRRALEVYAGNYLGDLDPRHPLVSPLYAELTGLPPLLIQAGGVETLLDDSRALTDRARAAGVDVELDVTDGAIHVFQVFAPFVPGAIEAIERIGEYVDRKLV